MRIQTPEYLETEYFYQFTLPQLIEFNTFSSDSVLILDLCNTQYIDNNVLCDILSYISRLKYSKYCDIYFLFGTSRRLPAYLSANGFLLHANKYNIVTDLVSVDDTTSKTSNIQNIGSIAIPPVNDIDDYQEYITRKITFRNSSLPLQQDIFSLFSVKKRGLSMIGVDDPFSILDIYLEIMENSYMYSNTTANNAHAYYTFQFYEKTGLTFCNSDYGPGFYYTMKRHLDAKKISLKLMDEYTFLSYSSDDKKKSIVGILEAICRWFPKSDLGFPYLFNKLIINRNGMLSIHSENTMLNINKTFLYEYFEVENDKVVDIRADKLKKIIFDYDTRQKLHKTGILNEYNYTFSGVHMTTTIRNPR